jgi:hypothetical protein
MFVLILCATTVLASQCVQWADSITQRWTSIFLPGREMSGCSIAQPADEEAYMKELFGAVPLKPVPPKPETSVPRKFQRGQSNPISQEELRKPADDFYGLVKSLEDRVSRLSEFQRQQLSSMSFLEEMLQGNVFEGREESSSSSSKVVPTETVTVIEHQPTNSAREKIIISIAL